MQTLRIVTEKKVLETTEHIGELKCAYHFTINISDNDKKDY
jgi:hypothetical protein